MENETLMSRSLGSRLRDLTALVTVTIAGALGAQGALADWVRIYPGDPVQ